MLDESNGKPNKTWVDKESKVYNRSMKSWLQDNDIEMYSRHTGEKSFVAEMFLRTLKNKIYKYIISVEKYIYTDKLADVVNEYNNTYHSTIKVKPANLKSSTYSDFSVENNDKYPKFEVGDHVRLFKFKNI